MQDFLGDRQAQEYNWNVCNRLYHTSHNMNSNGAMTYSQNYIMALLTDNGFSYLYATIIYHKHHLNSFVGHTVTTRNDNAILEIAHSK